MRRKKNELGSWASKRNKREYEPNEFRDTNRTLWIVLGGGGILTLILIISFFTAAHFFPSLFFFGSDNTAAVMEKQEVTMDEFQYYLTLAAQNVKQAGQDTSLWKDNQQQQDLKKRALELLQADRMYPLIANELELTIPQELQIERDKQLADLEQRMDTPLFQFQLQSRCLTPDLWRSLIHSECYKKTLEQYYAQITDPVALEQRARELYQDSYIQLKWIRISLNDSSGTPLPKEMQEGLRTKGYSIYQRLQSGEPFAEMQNQLAGEEQINVYDQLVTRGQLSEELEETAFSLEIGEISSLIETEQALFMIQRVNAEDEYETQEVAMVFLARQQLFQEWIDSYRKQFPIKQYKNNIKKMDAAAFLEHFYQQKEEADQQIEWMEKSQ